MIYDQLKLRQVAESFGADKITGKCKAFFEDNDFRYRVLLGKEKDDAILKAIKFIENDTQRVGVPSRVEVWEKGWKENLDLFRANHSLNDIVPKYFRPGQILRFNSQFIAPKDPNFQLNFVKLFQLWFFQKYMSQCSSIYEFGCGTGLHLVTLANLFPDKELFGLDFIESSVHLVNEIAKHYSYRLSASNFDMSIPDINYKIKANSVVFTCGSIEQLSGNFVDFIDYLIDNKPVMCCHIEPMTELLDDDNIVDYLATILQKKRQYAFGLLPHMYQLEKEGIIDILSLKRLSFGDEKMEQYNYIIWKVKER